MFSLLFTLLFVLAALIVSGLFFKGRVWSPTVTAFGYRVKVTIAVPQVAFSIAPAPTAPAKAATPIEQTPPAPPSAK